MDNLTKLKDSPIWNFLQEHHSDLPDSIKRKTFELLQEYQVPTTDKVFPWVVVAVINRVIEELLRDDLQGLRREVKAAPKEIGQELSETVKAVLAEPVQEIRSARKDVRGLTQELRASAVLNASLAQSGWRGIGAAFGAIFRLESLGIVVAGLIGIGFVFGMIITYWFAAGNRQVIQFNKGVIQDCHQNYAVDEDKNGWYTCPIFQLPMPND